MCCPFSTDFLKFILLHPAWGWYANNRVPSVHVIYSHVWAKKLYLNQEAANVQEYLAINQSNTEGNIEKGNTNMKSSLYVQNKVQIQQGSQ